MAKATKKKKAATPKKTGRPSLFNDRLAAKICSAIAQGGKLKDICAPDDMPCCDSVYLWLSQKPVFSEQYARAQADRMNHMAEEIIDISDDGHNDWQLRTYGETEAWVANGEALQRSRLRVDTRKWLMSKMAPKKYGDKLELAGDAKAPLTVLVQKFIEPDANDQNTK